MNWGNVFMTRWGRHSFRAAERGATRIVLTQDVSSLIKIARVLCILSLIYVHMPPYEPYRGFSSGVVPTAIWLIRQVVGRSSVPLLSIVSGYLYVVLMRDRSFFHQIRKKAISLLIPLVLWNLIVLAKDMAGGGGVPMASNGDLLNSIFSLSEPPRVEPLYFLRDMFVCSIVASPLLWMLTRSYVPTLLFLFVNCVMNLDGLIILNSGILLFFAIGMVFALMQLQYDGCRQSWFVLPVLFAGLAAIAMAGLVVHAHHAGSTARYLANALELSGRFLGAFAFYQISLSILRSRSARFVQSIEPAIFFIFCSHSLCIGMLWAVIRYLGIDGDSAVYAALFLLSPLLVGTICYLVLIVGCLVLPRAIEWLVGGRAPSLDRLLDVWPGRRPVAVG